MSAYYMYLGGCVVAGSAYVLATKIFSTTDEQEQSTHQPTTRDVTKPNTETSEDPSTTNSENDLDDAVRGINLYSKKRQEMLEKELSQAKAMVAELQGKYNVNLNDLSTAKELDAVPVTTEKRRSKSRKRESRNSDSSSDGGSIAATVILKTCSENQSSVKCGGNDASSTVYTDAESSSTGSDLSKQESVPEDPLLGSREVEPNEKVEKWLSTNPEKTDTLLSHDSSVRNDKHVIRPKPAVMSIPVKNLSANKKDRSSERGHEDCFTNVPKSPKRESPKKLAPHLYKRLLLRKKSSVPVEESLPGAKSKSRNHSPENKNKLQSKPEEKLREIVVPKKVITTSEADLRNKKHGAKQEHVLEESSSDLRNESENEGKTAKDDNNDNSYAGRSKSDHFIDDEPPNESSDENALQNENSKTNKRILWKRVDDSPVCSSRCPPGAITMTSEEINATFPTKLKTSHTRLKKKIDEVLGMKSTSFDKKKPVKRVTQRNESAPNLNRPPRQLDGPDSDEEMDRNSKTKSFDKKKEFQTKNILKSSISNQERSKSDGSDSDEELVWDTKYKSSDKKKELCAKDHMKVSCSNERPKSAGIDILSSKNFLEKRKVFTTSQERPKAADAEELCPKANPFDKRKLFQAKYHMKDASMQDVQKADEKEMLITTANPFEKRKEFQAKYHIKESPNKDGSESSERKVSNTQVNQFEKRKEFQAKYHMKESVSNQEGTKLASTEVLYTKSRSEKRKDFLAQYQMKNLSCRARSQSPENEEFLAKANADNKTKKLEEVSIQNSRKPAEKQPLYAKAAKATQLRRRMEYDAKFRMNFVSSNLSVRNSPDNEGLNVKTSLFEKKKEYNTNVRMKDSGSNFDSRATAEKLTTLTTADEDDLKKCVTMNRLPNDSSRKAYLFDWERKRYALIGDKPDTVVDSPPEIEPRKSRGSSIPPKGKRLPPPRDVKRPLSAGSRLRNAKPPTSLPTRKLFPNVPVDDSDSEDDGSSAGERSMNGKNSTEWNFYSKAKPFKPPLPVKSLGYKQHSVKMAVDTDSEDESEDGLAGLEETSLGRKSSSDWGFDAKGLDDSNLSNRTNSEESEEAMINDLQKNGVEFISMEPSCETISDEDVEREAIDAMLDEFIFPKCPSDFLPNEYNTRPKLQTILDLPMNCSDPSFNDNLLSRSESGINSEDESSLSTRGSNVTNASLITSAAPAGKLRRRSRGSSDVLAVLTDGYKQLALEEILDDSFKERMS